MRSAAYRRITLFLTLIFCLTIVMPAPAAERYATLRYGDSGSAVQAMQEALVALGFDTKGVDGKFGRGTENAVKQFQQSKGLAVDGLAGHNTLSALYSAAPGESEAPAASTPVPTASSSSSSSGSYSTLRYGSTGDAVRNLQSALTGMGYDTKGVDGKFGRGTENAVKQFQRNNGLVSDGLAGSKTLSLVYSMAGNSGSPTAAPVQEATATPVPEAAATPVPEATQAPSSGTVTLSRTLRKGYTGDDVRYLQQLLTELNYYAGSHNATYDDATMAAVKAFQSNNGLTADGLAGAKTYAVLLGGSAKAAGVTSAPQTTYTTLKLNSTGAAVTALQKALQELGYVASVTGTYSSETRSAVADFQLRNNLTADGIAGQQTQTVLYSGSAKSASTELPALEAGAGVIDGPSKSQVQLLHWYNDVKPSVRSGQQILVFDPATSRSWTLRFYSLGHHADSEPLTLRDTQIMNVAFGNKTTWTPKPVYVKLPDGRWTVAATHNTPHLSGSILGNGFDGHLCVHFLRDMSECMANDPDYGVTNQNVIRNAWKKLTGETYVEKN